MQSKSVNLQTGGIEFQYSHRIEGEIKAGDGIENKYPAKLSTFELRDVKDEAKVIAQFEYDLTDIANSMKPEECSKVENLTIASTDSANYYTLIL